ncbi:tail fiber protein [Budviciaceae bacterium BWR-B9]|uniref:Tail fiber protein n=1 Tax=Limnobaculum allomyrinae TaxID=2791986 RepID=A0ABS1IVY0_9GAMM|nr:MULTISPECIES: phage tail protein [Limnobaculum]MBK5145927.1 tail fiber protein [Limnobaculum allomyrinae]MBV7694018.1 phage tail protein [Limnobaculum sp. M2-1]
MANLPEKEEWEEVYQWETSDRALGGPGGVMNKPLLNLANRTAFLKKALEGKASTTPASLNDAGIVKLSNAINSDSNADAATASAVKKAYDLATEKLTKESNLSDLTDVTAALENLRLGAGAPAIGIPFFWPSAAMPNTVMPEWSDMIFLKFNGAAFSAATYPKLALVFPSLILTESRGEFLRVWDDGRGVDNGRSLLSAQSDAIRNITGEIGYIQYVGSTHQSGALSAGGSQNLTNVVAGGQTVAQSIFFSAAGSVPTASENRPRNIAFNLLVRAK